MPIILDLFSGSGSATAIWQNEGFSVWRYDIVAPEKPYTQPCDLNFKWQCDEIISDVKNCCDHPLLIWASPPCPEYSHMNVSRNDLWAQGILPDLTLWKNALYIIHKLKPKHYVIENVKGAARVWGPPRQKFGPYHLWGNFPLFNVPDIIPNKSIHSINGPWRPGDTKKSRANESAKVPYVISYHLYRAITLQKTLIPPY